MAGGFAGALAAAIGVDRVQQDAPLAPLTTFRVGGPADWLVSLRSEDELRRVLALAGAHQVPVTLLGGGSNVVVADAGVRGLVVRLQLHDIGLAGPERVRAGAGVTINGLVRWTISHGLAGLEAWAGTPGTVGGAVYGNAHWSGVNIGDRLVQARLASIDGDVRTTPGGDLGFAYDTSRLQRTREILIWAEFRIEPGVVDELRARARVSLAYRKRTQPLASPSAGCVFQNPDPERDRVPAAIPPSAGALVDRAGLKGHRIGGAVVSSTHANFVVNDGTATAADVRAVIELARQTVLERFGVALRDEVVFLGNW